MVGSAQTLKMAPKSLRLAVISPCILLTELTDPRNLDWKVGAELSTSHSWRNITPRRPPWTLPLFFFFNFFFHQSRFPSAIA